MNQRKKDIEMDQVETSCNQTLIHCATANLRNDLETKDRMLMVEAH